MSRRSGGASSEREGELASETAPQSGPGEVCSAPHLPAQERGVGRVDDAQGQAARRRGATSADEERGRGVRAYGRGYALAGRRACQPA